MLRQLNRVAALLLLMIIFTVSSSITNAQPYNCATNSKLTIPSDATTTFATIEVVAVDNCEVTIGKPGVTITADSILFSRDISNSSIVVNGVKSSSSALTTAQFIRFTGFLKNISRLTISNIEHTFTAIGDGPSTLPAQVNTVSFAQFVTGSGIVGSAALSFQSITGTYTINSDEVGSPNRGNCALISHGTEVTNVVSGFDSVTFKGLHLTVDGVTTTSQLSAITVKHANVTGISCASSTLTYQDITLTLKRCHSVSRSTVQSAAVFAWYSQSDFRIIDVVQVTMTVSDFRVDVSATGGPSNDQQLQISAVVFRGPVLANSSASDMGYSCEASSSSLSFRDLAVRYPPNTPGFAANNSMIAYLSTVIVQDVAGFHVVDFSRITFDFNARVFSFQHTDKIMPLSPIRCDSISGAQSSSSSSSAALRREDLSRLTVQDVTLHIGGGDLRFDLINQGNTGEPNSASFFAVQCLGGISDFAELNFTRIVASIDAPVVFVNPEQYFEVGGVMLQDQVRTVPSNVSNDTLITFSGNRVVVTPRVTEFSTGSTVIVCVRISRMERFGLFLVENSSIFSQAGVVLGHRRTNGLFIAQIVLLAESAIAREVPLGGAFLVRNCSVRFLSATGGQLNVDAPEFGMTIVRALMNYNSSRVLSSFTIDGCSLHAYAWTRQRACSVALLHLPSYTGGSEAILTADTINFPDSLMLFSNNVISGGFTASLNGIAVAALYVDTGAVLDFNLAFVNTSLLIDYARSGETIFLAMFTLLGTATRSTTAPVSSAQRPAILVSNASIVVTNDLNAGNNPINAAALFIDKVLNYNINRNQSAGGIVVRDFLMSITSIVQPEGGTARAYLGFLVADIYLNLGVGDILIERATALLPSEPSRLASVKFLVFKALVLGEAYANSTTLRDITVVSLATRNFVGVEMLKDKTQIRHGVELDNWTIDIKCDPPQVSNDDSNADVHLTSTAVKISSLRYLRITRVRMRAIDFLTIVIVFDAVRVASILVRDLTLDLYSGKSAVVDFQPKSDGDRSTSISTPFVRIERVTGSIVSAAATRLAFLFSVTWTFDAGLPDSVFPAKYSPLQIAVVDCQGVRLQGTASASMVIVSKTSVLSITVNNSRVTASPDPTPLLLGSAEVRDFIHFGSPCTRFNGPKLTADRLERIVLPPLTTAQRDQIKFLLGTLPSNGREFMTKFKVAVDPLCMDTATATASHLATPSHPLTLTANDTFSHEATQSLTATTTRQFFLKAKREAFSGVAAVTSLGGMLGGGSAFSLTQKMMALQAMSQCPLSDPLAETPEAGLDTNLLGIRIYSPTTFDNPSDVGDLQLSTSSTDAGRVVMASWRGAVVSCFVCAVIVVLVSAAVVYGRVLWSNRNSSKSNNESRSRNNSSRRRSSSSSRSSTQPAATMTFERMSRTMGFPGFTIGAALIVSCASACTALGVIMSLFQAPAVDGPVFGFGVAALLIVPIGVLLWMGYRAHRDEKVKIAERLPTWTEIHGELVAAAIKEQQNPEQEHQQLDDFNSSATSSPPASARNRQNGNNKNASSLPLTTSLVLPIEALYKYLMDPWSTWQPSPFVDCWAPMTFDNLRDARYFAFDLCITAITSGIGGSSFGCRTKTCCSVLSIVVLVASAVQTASLAWLRPWTTRFDVVVCWISSILTVVTSTIVLVMIVTRDDEVVSPDVCQALSMFGQVVGFVAIVLGTLIPWIVEVVCKAQEAWTAWRAERRRRVLEEAEREVSGGSQNRRANSRHRRFSSPGQQSLRSMHGGRGDDCALVDDRAFLREMLLSPAERTAMREQQQREQHQRQEQQRHRRVESLPQRAPSRNSPDIAGGRRAGKLSGEERYSRL